MKVDNDTKERLKVLLIFMLQSYKVVMGSMLTLFVPQVCDNGVCGLVDNMTKEGDLHRVSLGINFISMISFLVCYYIELQRENWCIKYLDISDDHGDNNLPLLLKDMPELEVKLHEINDKYYYSSQITAGIYTINLILSTISVYEHSAGAATVTSYISFVILVLFKLNNAIAISKDSKNNNMALSAYMTELQSFNVLDEDYKDFLKYKDVKTDDVEIEIVGEEKSVDKKSEDKKKIGNDNILIADLNSI